MTGLRMQLVVVDDVADTLDGAVEAEEITRDQVIPVILTVLSSAIASLPTAAERRKKIDMVTQNLADAVEEAQTRKAAGNDDSQHENSRH